MNTDRVWVPNERMELFDNNTNPAQVSKKVGLVAKQLQDIHAIFNEALSEHKSLNHHKVTVLG